MVIRPNRRRSFPALPLLVPLAFFAVAAQAEEVEEVVEVEAGETMPRNHIGLFIGSLFGGAADEGGREDPAATAGLEYERRLSRHLGVGVLVEHAGGSRRDFLGLVPFSYWPLSRTKITVAAGFARSKGTEIFEGKTDAVLRLGFAYDIEFPTRHTVAPEVSVDWVDGEALYLVGVTIGRSF